MNILDHQRRALDEELDVITRRQNIYIVPKTERPVMGVRHWAALVVILAIVAAFLAGVAVAKGHAL